MTREIEKTTIYSPKKGVRPAVDLINSAGLLSPRGSSKRDAYSRAIITFDIETSLVKNESWKPGMMESKKEFNILFCWQFLVYDPASGREVFIFGRERKDFFSMIKKISKGAAGMPLIWIHNLAYEYNNMAVDFVKGMDLEEDPPFFKSPIRPLVFRSYGCEFRCSAELTHKSLAKLGKDVGLEKLKDDFDYNVIRYPDTPLTDMEMEYCYRDVKILALAIAEEVRKYSHQTGKEECSPSLPYTQTGYVRRDIKNVFTHTHKGHQIVNQICKLNEEKFSFVNAAFIGGYTTSNFNYLDFEVEKPLHVDLTSAYPAAMVMFTYPYGLHWSSIMPDYEKWKGWIRDERQATISEVRLKNVCLKPDKAPFIPAAKLRDAEGVVSANGKVLYLSSARITLCDIDAVLMDDSYMAMSGDELSEDNVEVIRCLRGDKRRMPAAVVITVLRYFFGKTAYKHVPGKEIEYALSKQMLNGIFGLTATSLEHEKYVLNDELISLPSGEVDFTESPVLPYQWSLYITAYVHRWIYGFIQSLSDVNLWIYSDTDSMFLFDKPECRRLISEHNARIMEELKKIDEVIPCIPKDPKGEAQYLGLLLDDEPADLFCSIGAKRYYTYLNGVPSVTFAGMSGTKPISKSDHFSDAIQREYDTRPGAAGINTQRLIKKCGSLREAFRRIRDESLDLPYLEGVDHLIGVNLRIEKKEPPFRHTGPDGRVYKDKASYVLQKRSKKYALVPDLYEILSVQEGVTVAGPGEW